MPIIFDLLEHEGLCMGGSTGINVAGAIRLAKELGPGHTIVTMLCDYGTRYQSKLFNPEFLRSKNLPVPEWLERKSDIKLPFEKRLMSMHHGRPTACSARMPICGNAARPWSASPIRAASCSTARCSMRRRAASPATAACSRRLPATPIAIGNAVYTDPGKTEIAHMPASAGARAVGRRGGAASPSTGSRATRACGCTPRCICSRPCCPIR